MTFPGGIHPFWFWNDRLEAGEIRRQIAEMAAQGTRGFFIHSRQGLGQPYLSDAFFEMVDAAIAAAAEHGMTVQLYDEYPYPSGAAGGETTLGAPEFLATHLAQVKHDVTGGRVRLDLPRGQVLGCAAYPLRDGGPDWSAGRDLRSSVGMSLVEGSFMDGGLTQYNRKRYFACRPTPILETELPPGAWRVYASVQVVVEGHKYWNNFPDMLNPEAVARFLNLTHERYRARYGKDFGKRILSIFTDETAPGWSARLPEAFRRRCGYDLLPLLPALHDEGHPEHLRVRADLERVRYQLFCEAFEEPIAAWCRRHGLMYVAEKNQLRLAQLRYLDVPGCDVGHTKAGARPDWLGADIRFNARATASAAWFYGKAGSLCECYHSLGWGATIQDAKLIADGLLLLGITTLVPHGFFYTTHNLRKHDAPPSFFFQMPYWPWWGRLARRIEKVLAAFAGTHPDAEVLIVEPSPGLPTKEMKEVYVRLQETLMDARLDFLMVDTDMLEGARIREIPARVVVVPPMRVVEPLLAAWLERFAKSGGVVVRPTAPFDAKAFLAEVRAAAKPSLRLQAEDGGLAAGVWATVRRGGGRTLWFIVNTTAQPHVLRCDAGVPLRELPLDDGLPPRLIGNQLSLAPFESCLLEAGPPDAPNQPPAIVVTADGPARVRPLNANLVRLGEWDLTVADQTSRVPAVPLANQLAAGRFRFAPTFALGFGVPAELGLPRLTAHYACAFGCEYEGPVTLVMEPGSIVGHWRWRLNGGEWRNASVFGPAKHHVRGSLGVEVTAALRPGENRIEVAVETNRPDGGLLNPLYLAGDFAVAFRPPASVPWLTRTRRDVGRFEHYAANGLPYYAGVVEYETEFSLPALPEGETLQAELRYARSFQEATEVSFNEGPWRPVLWEPRRLLVARSELRAGMNRLRTRVYTTLCRSFEGQWFDPATHRYRGVEQDPEP